MMELLKEGDFVIVYDSVYGGLSRGIVTTDEIEDAYVSISALKNGAMEQGGYPRKDVTKVS